MISFQSIALVSFLVFGVDATGRPFTRRVQAATHREARDLVTRDAPRSIVNTIAQLAI